MRTASAKVSGKDTPGHRGKKERSTLPENAEHLLLLPVNLEK